MGPFETTSPLTPDNRLTFVDVFAGAGGLSLGLMNAGLRGLFAVEREKNAFETLSANLLQTSNSRPKFDWPAWLPQKPWEIGKLLRVHREKLGSLRGSVDLLAGGPPCQGFSSAGRRRRSDPRNRLFGMYVEMARLLKPSFLVFENVPWIAVEFGKDKRRRTNPRRVGRPAKAILVRIVQELDSLGYHVFVLQEKAVEFGVPQLRPRCLIIGIAKDLGRAVEVSDVRFRLEEERRAHLAKLGLPYDGPVSVKEAISDLETAGARQRDCTDSPGFREILYTGPKTHYQRLMHQGLGETDAPNSMRIAKHRVETINRFEAILAGCRKGVVMNPTDRERFGVAKLSLTPLHPDRPSHTLTSLPDDLLHYAEPRILTVREYARLQSFPDWFEFRGKYTTGGKLRKKECPRYTQVANAVPPLLAEVLGLAINRLASDLAPRASKALLTHALVGSVAIAV